ncbi:MAG: NAD-dependent deacetylase [Deltaproteobacteria bacterium]|nr:MAG: NAD-dependent deacetylase [Deltaproteobacteria bacterium]
MTEHGAWLPTECPVASDEEIDRVAEFLARGRVLVLTGAGCSTESGIPDYRGPITRLRPRTPLTWQAFADDLELRRRYWARSFVGWSSFRDARPCAAHRALVALESASIVQMLLTQNVDGLHERAGHQAHLELHGSLWRATCPDCGHVIERNELQEILARRNPEWARCGRRALMAPDGDADVDGGGLTDFALAPCPSCGGDRLKPGVVMFGESVPHAVREASLAALSDCAGLLVVGSSLSVYSGFRYVQRAAQQRIPACLVNIGLPVRGGELFSLRVDGRAGDVLVRAARRVGAIDSLDIGHHRVGHARYPSNTRAPG